MHLTADFSRLSPTLARLYQQYLAMTDDVGAAATLTLASVLQGLREQTASDLDGVITIDADSVVDATLALPPRVKRERGSAETPPDAGPFTVKQAARIMGVKDRTVYSLRKDGKLAHHRIGSGRGTIRIKRDDLQRYLDRQRVEHRVEEAVEDHLFGLP